MKTRRVMYAVCLSALAAAMVPQAFGCPICPVQDGDVVKITAGENAGRYDGGGNFVVHNQNNTVADFLSYCLERNEYINLGSTYTALLDDAAVRGGVGGGNPDPLDTRTAYLYSNAFFGTLDALVSLDGLAVNKALQEAIWFIEEELPILHTLSLGAAELVDLADDNANGSLYDVKVMNLVTRNADNSITHNQSLLTVCIPEPSTMAIWGVLGMCGMVVARRRRK